ncbi:hypothetical protein [Anaerorhabdus sp.]|uniref:hypothetical protein n=1 Tax=Anaerorhabdus sp. TaxID=1872524 RepID=UPI002FC60416
MKKLITLVLMLCLSISLLGCSKQEVSTNNPKLDDLNMFYNTLSKNHKNLYANISKEELETEKNKIGENIETMSDSDFYYSLRHLLSLVGDAHTMLDYTDAKYSYLHALPFAIVKFDDGWHLMIINDEYKDYLGTKVLSINDIPMQEVVEKAKSIISYENEAWLETQLSNAINFKEALEYLGIINIDEDIYLTIETTDASIVQIPIIPLTEEEVQQAQLAWYERKQTPITAAQEIYRYLPLDNDTLFIQYNSCQEDPNLSMKDFAKQVETELSSTTYNTIIIDLRYNTGGNSSIINPLLNVLKKYQMKNNTQFYTLIGSSTFSSGIMNSIDTIEELNSTLLGSPSGGNVNGYGELKYFTLENTPITVSYSTKYFELIKDYEKDSLYPDISIPQSYENFENGVDAEIQWIMQNK